MSNQKGFSVFEGLLVVVLISAVALTGYFVTTRNSDTNYSQEDVETSDLAETLPENLEGIKTVEEIEQISGVGEGVQIISFKLESEDDGYRYIVVLSNGRKLVIDASSGNIIKEETTDVSNVASNLSVNVSIAQAYAIAAERSSSPVKDIEFEVEDNKVTYKIEYKDGSKIEIDATNGQILKSEIKNEDREDERDDEDDRER